MSFGKWLWKKWLKIGHVIGNFQAQVILTAFYFVIVWPIGVVCRVFGDLLDIKPKRIKSNFKKWDYPKEDLAAARKQF